MKKFILPIALLCFFACSPTPQEKAESLIKNATLKALYFPESYDPIETVLDSAFTPYQDPSFVNAILEINKKGVELEGLEAKMKRAKSDMTIWSGPYMTSYARNQYNEAKKEYESAQSQIDVLTARIQKMAEDLRPQVEKAPEFIGFQAHHTYRAKNNSGETLIGDVYFILNKELDQIMAIWEKDEIDTYNAFLNQAAEASSE